MYNANIEISRKPDSLPVLLEVIPQTLIQAYKADEFSFAQSVSTQSMQSALCQCGNYLSFHFLPFDLATTLDVHKSYMTAVVAERLNCLGVGFVICFTSMVVLKVYSMKILESPLTGNAFRKK